MIALSHLIHSQLGIYLNYNYFMASFIWFNKLTNIVLNDKIVSEGMKRVVCSENLKLAFSNMLIHYSNLIRITIKISAGLNAMNLQLWHSITFEMFLQNQRNSQW